MGKPEGTIERYLKQKAEKNGFLYFKFTSPSTDGVPDRILIGYGHTVFVECKRPGEEPRKLQWHVIRKMEAAGAIVKIISTKEQCDELILQLKNHTL